MKFKKQVVTTNATCFLLVPIRNEIIQSYRNAQEHIAVAD